MLPRASEPSVAVVVTLSNRHTFTADEEISFRHVRQHLGRYDTYAVMPESHPATYAGLRSMRFPDRFFGSGHAHAALLLSEGFYQAFAAYTFILLYHLDALVFSDQLAGWCAAGFDYIGAPWLICADTPHITAEKVGNGGFSLRRVASFLRVLRSRRYFVDPEEYWRNYRQRSGPVMRTLNQPRRLVKRLRFFNDVRWHRRLALAAGVHEDRFWAEYATHYDPSFRIAPVDVAMRFAFEAEPRACFARTGQMPFGAHRWMKFDRAFYEPHLITEGLGSGVSVAGATADLSNLRTRMAHQ